MLRFDHVDRMCIATLTGRFGVQLMSLQVIKKYVRPRAGVGALDIIQTPAVWTNACRSVESGTR